MSETTSPHVLVIDDDPWIHEVLGRELQYEGYRATFCLTGEEGVYALRDVEPDLIVLDLMLPDKSGYDLCKDLREGGLRVPILVLSSRELEADKVRLLDAGANDYVTKPFGMPELLARVRVQLRLKEAGEMPNPALALEHRDLILDLTSRELLRGEERITLTSKEFAILRMLFERAGDVVTRDEFLKVGWGDVVVTQRTIDTHMVALRHKLGAAPDGGPYIASVRGVGYRLIH